TGQTQGLGKIICFKLKRLCQDQVIFPNMNWTEAQQHCRDEYTDLATVSTMADMERLREIHSEKREIWIGLFKQTGTNATSHWSLPGLQFNESQANAMPNIATKHGSSAYKYYLGDKMTWFDALRYCRENHTDLISGPQLEELQKHDNPTEKIIQLQTEGISNPLSSFQYIFIGLFRDIWTWSDGSSFSFRHWNVKYNSSSVKYDCTMLNKDGMWQTDDCNNRKPFFCYTDHVILIKENRTWEEALYYCRHHHHDLVTITNMDEQRWVQEKTKNASSPFVWTGLRYTCSLGFWFWVSDEVVHYKNWASPEQANECDMSGAMETGGEHKWFKKHDEEKFNFFCSK
uniref:C-type lectin domain-containing protein n=1 Tax=Oryzias sinensis TaxID=183150 RepID=A0A8C7YL37_9TELE